MELLQLHYFRVTARHEHMTAAAKELHIAQPALSQTIKRLESELGTPLFDRKGRHIRLNTFGTIFLKYTETALNALDDARIEINELQKNPKPQIQLGVQAASWLLPDILEQFSKQYPAIQFQIFQALGRHDTSESVDLTIEASLLPPADTNKCILLKEPLLAAIPAQHPLADESGLPLRQLADMPFACLHPESDLYHIVRHYCNQAGFEPQIALSCDNPQTFRELLHLHKGISLIPGITWPDMNGQNIVTRPIVDMDCSRYILLSWDKDRYQTRSAQLLKNFLVDYFGKLSPKHAG